MRRGFQGWRTLGLILGAALIHGVIYIFIMPPWQHYDEPSHFEHVWLIASQKSLPPSDTFDANLHRRLVGSMLEFDFYRGLPLPDVEGIEDGNRVAGLEYSQLTEPPLYYLLASVPVSVLQTQDLAVQLYGARGVSLVLFILTVFAVWGFTAELTPVSSPLRVLVPLSAALLPGFVDLMTAVNNDVGAVAMFSWFLWGCVRLLQRGWSWGNIFWLLASMAACVFTKSTVFLAIPLVILVLFLFLVRKQRQEILWGGVAIFSLLTGLLAFHWQDAANWHRATSQPLPTRVKNSQAPLGDYALQLEVSAETTPDWLRPLNQPLSGEEFTRLGGKTVTLGVWMWVSPEYTPLTPIALRTPTLNIGAESFYETVQVGTNPVFYSFKVSLPEKINKAWLALFPIKRDDSLLVFYDGLVLAEGAFPLDEEPVFDSTGDAGTWGGLPFQNLVRNPSGEHTWPALRPILDTPLAKHLPDNMRPSMLLSGILDWPHTRWYFRVTLQNMLETFLGKFGWGHIPLSQPAWYTLFGVLFGVGFLGVLWACFSRVTFSAEKMLFLGTVLGLIWGAAVLRGEIFMFTATSFIPGARYAYPAIAPTLLFWLLGIEWIGSRISRGWRSREFVKELSPFMVQVDRWLNVYIISRSKWLAVDCQIHRWIWRSSLSDCDLLIITGALFLLVDYVSVVTILKFY